MSQYILKDMEYIASPIEETDIGQNLGDIFSRVAAAQGIRLSPTGGRGLACSLQADKDIPFSNMQDIMNKAARIAGTKLVLSLAVEMSSGDGMLRQNNYREKIVSQKIMMSTPG